MIIVVAALLAVGAVAFTLLVRPQDIPVDPPSSPTRPLEERKTQIYDGLRDLQFEFRVGKLSEDDYQKSKLELQKELARVMAQIDAAIGPGGKQTPPPRATKAKKETAGSKCPHCGAEFAEILKFCGECGKPIAGGAA